MLPRELRRKALYSALDLTAPRASSPDRLRPGPLIVGGQLTTASGLGESARLCLDALRNLDWDAGHADISTCSCAPTWPTTCPGHRHSPVKAAR